MHKEKDRVAYAVFFFMSFLKIAITYEDIDKSLVVALPNESMHKSYTSHIVTKVSFNSL